jgi:cytochrome c peroxidase
MPTLLLTLLLALSGNASAAEQPESRPATPRPQEPILPLPQALPNPDIDRILLGERLFHDARLSSNNTISCANCHPIPKAGADGLALSPGVGGALGTMNSPTVFNSGYNLAQFWDGRAATLEDQIDGPVTNPLEMAGNWPDIIAKLEQDPELSAAFEQVFGRPWDSDGIKAAIAAYERSLITPNSAFDRYLRGDDQALNKNQRQGYALFKSYGCIACHQGRNVGGNMYSQLGIVNDYFIGQASPSKRDLGRYNVTGDSDDRHVFKVPGLRMVVRTAPYFHDGSIATLEETITVMGRYQLGREIPAADIPLLIEFLGSLEGKYQRLSR